MGPQNIAYPGAPKQMGQNAFQHTAIFPYAARECIHNRTARGSQ